MYRWAGKQSMSDEYWRNSCGLAWASDDSDIIGPEKGHLSEAGQNSLQLASLW
jgi:hypothetical protein